MRIIQFIILITISTLPIATASAEMNVRKNIPYVAWKADKRQKLDIYVPHRKNNVTKLPVHIYVHGGAWNIGDKRNVTANYAKTYTNSGVILVAINYRLSPKHKHPAHIEDCAQAIKWIVENIHRYGGDANNMVLSGHSAGAHLVALLGTHPKYLQKHQLQRDIFKAIMPVDTATFDLTIPWGKEVPKIIRAMRVHAFGKDINTLQDASPIMYITKSAQLSPFITFVTSKRGNAVQESKTFTQALTSSNHKARLEILEGRTHKEMNTEIFTTGTLIHETIINAFK